MPRPFKVAIANLFPHESSVIRSTVESYRTKLRRKKHIKPPTVLMVDGEWLVVDGNNRVYAAKVEGFTVIQVVERSHADPQALIPYRNSLQRAIAAGQQGFANLPVRASSQERTEETLNERFNIDTNAIAKQLGFR